MADKQETEMDSSAESHPRTSVDMACGVTVVYHPKVLRSMAEICEAFGVGKETLRSWVKAGAPIAIEGDGKKKRYSSEVAMLQAWRFLNKTI